MDARKIIKLYTQDMKSCQEIAEKYGTYSQRIRRLLLKHGIQMRDKSKAQSNALKSGRHKHPTRGTTMKLETKIKLSASMQEIWNNMPEEEYQRRVDASKARWNEMPEEEKEALIQKAREAIRSSGNTGSRLEKFLQERLTEKGHMVIMHKTGFLLATDLEVDLFLPQYGLCIEVDGPSHHLPIWGEDALRKRIKADNRKTGLILGLKLKLIRIKNLGQETYTYKEALIKRVEEIIEEISNGTGERAYLIDEVENNGKEQSSS